MTHFASPDRVANLPAALQAIGRMLECAKDDRVFRKGEIVHAVFLVLDVGCGTGYFTRRLASESGVHVVGLDPNSWARDPSTRRPLRQASRAADPSPGNPEWPRQCPPAL
jgi:SAM-dependent methyltransferase